MAIKQFSPDDAHTFLEACGDAAYIDVRTPGEFANGHAEGAINIPITLSQGGGMQANFDTFKKVVEALLPKDKPFVIGCQAGGRSQRACEFMETLGYAELYNVAGGFGKWLQCGLPSSTTVDESSSYDALLKKAGAAL